jgi:ribosomal protein S8
MKENLFEAVKKFVNNVPVGETFLSSELIKVAGQHEQLTRWKKWNNNPHYRTHTYKSYLKRVGFLSNTKKGEWKVEKHIFPSINLGVIEFLLGYGSKDTYNGKTKSEWRDIINNTPIHKFKVKDVLEFEGGKTYAAQKGATGICKGHFIGHGDVEYVDIEWIRDGLDNNQMNGGYLESQFTKVEEKVSQKEDRIFEEKKDMKNLKYNFEEGKQRVINMLNEHTDDFTHDMLQDIRMIINQDQDEKVEQIEDIIQTIRNNTHFVEEAIEKVNKSKTIIDILTSMKYSCYEEMEETVLNELFGLNSIVSI